jgi:transmembrane sensor
LNAGSSLRYPVAFSGTERRVEMTGEIYFEVAGDGHSRPFVVQKDTMEIMVLGTCFNVNAYNNEAAIRVTLLQGKVNIRQGKMVKTLSPGQQAQVTERIIVKRNVDQDQVVAWKNDKFDFGEGTDLHAIMRQIARWYDVEVEYRGAMEQSFGGSVSRQVNISKVLEKLALTDRVKFQLEGRKVIVLP